MHLYHGTSKKNKQGILEKGLLGSKSVDPESITNKMMGGIGTQDGRHLVYTSKTRTPALLMAMNQKSMLGEDPAMVKMSIPYKDYKEMRKTRGTDKNPEFQGMSKEEFIKKGESMGANKTVSGKYYDTFSGNKEGVTRIFEGDIDSKYIKGSKNYQKNSLKELGEYVKNNPKRFAKGVAKGTAGVGLVAGGGYLMGKGLKKNKKKKEKE